MSPQTKAAYLAGFMDGEGSFSIVKSYQINRHVDGTKVKLTNYQLHIKVTNTNLTVLKWIQEHFGGQIGAKKREKRWKPSWDLTVTGNKAREKFILSILPYLIIKREQALVALEYVRMHGQEAPEKREQLRQKMIALNNSSQPHSKSQEANTPGLPEKERGDKIESDLHGDMQRAPAETLTA